MKALLNTTPNMSVEVEGETSADLFEQISIAQEVFTHEECGCCQSKDFRFTCRKDDDENKYYELQCQNLSCRAKLTFGVMKKSKNLFPKRHWNSLSDGDKKTRGLENQPEKLWLPNNGWFRWNGKKKED